MNKQDLINFIETSARLENICNLLDEPARLPADQRQMWINNYNYIANKAGLADYYDFDYNPPESLEEEFENSI